MLLYVQNLIRNSVKYHFFIAYLQKFFGGMPPNPQQEGYTSRTPHWEKSVHVQIAQVQGIKKCFECELAPEYVPLTSKLLQALGV